MKAGMRFVHERLKDYFINVDEILFHRRDNEHIKPKDVTDFDPKHLYYVYWCYCKSSKCINEGNKCKFYKGYIFGLGDTHQEILEKHAQSGSRISFKNLKDITESESSNDDESSSQKIKRKASKMISSKVSKQNSDRIKEKFRHKHFIESRKKLDLKSSDNLVKNNAAMNVTETLKPNYNTCNIRVVVEKLPSTVTSSQISGTAASQQTIQERDASSNESDHEMRPMKSLLIKRRSLLNEFTEQSSTINSKQTKVDGLTANLINENQENGNEGQLQAVYNISNNLSHKNANRFSHSVPLNNDSEPSQELDHTGFMNNNDEIDQDPANIAIDNPENNDTLNINSNIVCNGNEHDTAAGNVQSGSQITNNRVDSTNEHEATAGNNVDANRRNEANQSEDSEDEELARPLNDEGDISSSDEDEDDVHILQNNSDWGHIKVYKYRLYKYLKKQMPRVAENENLRNENVNNDENEPDLYREENKEVYLGLGKRLGSLSWQMTKHKKDDLFLRDIAVVLWEKRDLENRCLDLKKVDRSIPGRSPVKLVTPKKLNHYFRLYRNFLLEKGCANDKIRHCVSRSSRTLSYEIRDLRDKAIARAMRRLRRLRRVQRP